MSARLEVADIFRSHGEQYRQINDGRLGRVERRTMSAIEFCRTAELGGHVEGCPSCGAIRIAYNSCRNRHCPKCQGQACRGWLAARQSELLPVHMRWVARRPGFFLPVRVLSRLFRRLFLQELQTAFDTDRLSFFGDLAELAVPAAFIRKLAEVRRLEWVVYAKPPFGGPKQVLAYLGRYTHRIAIANSRLVSLADGKVAFRWRDYRHGGKAKLMTLDANEFIRRFLLHTLPDGFHRIRHYGFLANGRRAAKLDLCRRLLDVPQQPAPTSSVECDAAIALAAAHRCPCCGGQMINGGVARHHRNPHDPQQPVAEDPGRSFQLQSP